MEQLFAEYGASYDAESGELFTPPTTEDLIPHKALQFVALVLRLQDLILLTPERAASSFKEDVVKAITRSLQGQATIYEDRSPSSGLEYSADLLIEAPDRKPVAVYLAQSEQRVLEAVVTQMAITYEAADSYSVIALLEKDSSISRKMRGRASNRLTAMPIYEGDEREAVQRIAREVLGHRTAIH